MTQNTPLYNALIREAGRKTVRMHMPGHKGKTPSNFDPQRIFEIDFTELPGTGNLYEGIPPISDAEELMAEKAKAANCFYITGGATQGVMTTIAVACPIGSTLIMDRGSHRSVWNTMAHLDLKPAYLYADKLEPCGIAAPIRPEQIEKAILNNPEAKAVIITSPTFSA
jgi:arginine/lysine/ornithine decarboxylase